MSGLDERVDRERKRIERGQRALDERISRKGNGKDSDAEINYIAASDVDMREVRWLWPDRIPLGKLTLLAGHPGVGKSTLMCSLASIASNGGEWPVDGTGCEAGAVVILSAEDDAEDTLVPRLCAAEAKTDRCYIVRGVIERDVTGRPLDRLFSLAMDVERLGAMVNLVGKTRLVVIDPVSAYLGATDAWRNTAIRAVLAPLAEMAARCGCAVVLVTHLNKGGRGGPEGAMLRVMDSLAFTAAARAAYLCVTDDAGENAGPRTRLFLPMKNNLAPEMQGLSYITTSVVLDNDIRTSRVEWGSALVATTADEAVAPKEERTMLQDARVVLAGALKEGPALQEEIRKLAKENEIGMRTMHRAGNSMGVVKRKPYGSNKYQWCLPQDLDTSRTSRTSHMSSTSSLSSSGCVPPTLTENPSQAIDSIVDDKDDNNDKGSNVTRARDVSSCDGEGLPDSLSMGERESVDSRHKLPLAAQKEMPPEDPSLPELSFSIVAAGALMVNINTRSAWDGARWQEFAHRYYGPFARFVGRKSLEDKEK